MKRTMGATIGFALALAGASTGTAAPQDPLARHQGASRLLVLSAPSLDDRRLAAQRAVIASARPGLRERDVLVVEAVGDTDEAAAVRRHLGLPADAFRAVLVGKDGGAKIISDDPIAPQRLFSAIDAMPMRRDEMRR